jgi:glycosyltransferase involved in cell wall biosynthesis
MKIGINALSITPQSTGGGTTYLVELLNQMSQIDTQNKYILFVRSDSRHNFVGYGSNFKFINIPVPPKLSVGFRILIEHLVMPFLILFLNLDVLFCPGNAIPLYCPCPSILVIQNLIIFHFSEASTLQHRKKRKFHIRLQTWYYNYIARQSAKKANIIITVSENAKNEIIEYFKTDSSKIYVVHHGLGLIFKDYVENPEQTQNTLEKYNLKPGYILYVGALAPHKNIDTIISTLSILKDRYSLSPRLVIAGADHAGYSKYLLSIGENLGVTDQITLLGLVPYNELPALYNKAEVFVMLSLCESFGFPILEAMACGCPVVSSNASSLPEIAGNAAVLVQPKNPIEAADAIKKLHEDKEFRECMIISGKKRATEFSWHEAASKTLDVIKQLGSN